MRIVQIVPTLAYGDAIGNDVMALKRALIEGGYSTDIYAETVVKPLARSTAKKIEQIKELKKEDIAILHLSTGAKINSDFAALPCRKIVRYHNVTPPQYFDKYDPYIARINRWALKNVAYLSDKVDYCLADSEFNKKELRSNGYQCKIDVLPILIPFDDYEKAADPSIIKKYKNVPVVLFTGRVVPNKRIEDVIGTFFLYKKYYNSDAVLILVGSYKENDMYFRTICEYIKKLNVKDVVFTGHVKFSEILAYYHIANVFLCQSEHEGFCVPLVEAMWFKIPIIGYNSTAIPDTLGGSAIVMNTKDPLFTAAMINRILTDDILRKKIIANEKERLQDFSYERIKGKFLNFIDLFIGRDK